MKYRCNKLVPFHYCFTAGTGRLTKVVSSESGISSGGLNRPINKYNNSTVRITARDWLIVVSSSDVPGIGVTST